MTWEGILKVIVVSLLITATALGVKWISMPATVTYMYTSADSGSTNTLCLWGYRPWHTDIRYFCSDDVNRVMDTMSKISTARGK